MNYPTYNLSNSRKDALKLLYDHCKPRNGEIYELNILAREKNNEHSNPNYGVQISKLIFTVEDIEPAYDELVELKNTLHDTKFYMYVTSKPKNIKSALKNFILEKVKVAYLGVPEQKAKYIPKIEKYSENLPKIENLSKIENYLIYYLRILDNIDSYSNQELKSMLSNMGRMWISAINTAETPRDRKATHIDIDDKQLINEIVSIIENIYLCTINKANEKNREKLKKYTIQKIVETSNGYHIICDPLDSKEFLKRIEQYNINKNIVEIKSTQYLFVQKLYI